MLLVSSYAASVPLQRLRIRAKGVGYEKTPLEILRKAEPAMYDNNFVQTSNKSKFGQFGKVRTNEGWVATQKLANITNMERLHISHNCGDDMIHNPGLLIAKLLLLKGWSQEKIQEKLLQNKQEATKIYNQIVELLAHNPKKHLIPILREKKKVYKKRMERPICNISINTDIHISRKEICHIDKITVSDIKDNLIILGENSKQNILLQFASLTTPLTT